MYQQIMTKNIAKLIAGIGLAGGLCGCTTEDYNTVIKDTPVDWALSSTRYALGGSDNKQNDPWEGTPIVSKQVDPDGTIIFIVDANKVDRVVPYGEIDSFVNTKLYDKRQIKISQNKSMYRFTPKQKHTDSPLVKDKSDNLSVEEEIEAISKELKNIKDN